MTRFTRKRAGMAVLFFTLILFISVSGFASPAYSRIDDQVSVIIGFRTNSDAEAVRVHGGQVKYTYADIKAVSAYVPSTEIDELKENPNVAYVEYDATVYALAQSTPWGVTKIEAPTVWAGGNKGAGVKVAVLDTGIDLSHPDLRIVGGATFVSGTASYDDDHGHGTHCAGIIAALDNSIGVVGVAPEAFLYSVKVLNSQGSGYISSIISGIEWCISNGINVVSMSFGSSFGSTALEAECKKAYDAGLVLVAAAGNSGPWSNTVGYPAKFSTVIAVGATDRYDVIASFSSRGPGMSVTAPGVNILSTYFESSYAYMSGTSMACPHTAGTAALVLKSASHTPAEVRNILQTTAVDLGPAGYDTTYGYGRINASAATLPAGTPPPPPTPNFSLSTSPNSVNIPAGSSRSSTVTVTSLSGFSGNVGLSTLAPAGWTASPSPNPLTVTSGGTANSVVTVTAPSSATAGAYTVTITGTSGSLIHSTVLAANVQTAPSAPLNLVATTGNAQVYLSWSAPSSNGGAAISSYKVYRRTASTAEIPLVTVGNVFSYIDNAVTNGETYFYRVAAVNSIGESPRSNEASATPSATSPPPSIKSMNVAVKRLGGPVFARGSQISITATVTDSSTGTGLAGAIVALTIYYPDYSIAATISSAANSEGRALFRYQTGASSPAGFYLITATASFAGYQSGSGQSFFQLV